MKSRLLAIALTLITCSTVCAAERTWTRSEILAIADHKARKEGLDVERMTVAVDYTERERVPAWKVRYFHMRPTLGGAVEIFIDRNTGQIIDIWWDD